MKIRIKETEHKAFTLVLPNFLFTSAVARKWLNKKLNMELDRQQLKEIRKTLNKFKKRHKEFVLSDVKSEDSEVQILW